MPTDLAHSQNWLLTYLDVFVLIVVLVITLITLRDINTEQQGPKKHLAICLQLSHADRRDPAPPVVAENKPVKQIAPAEHEAEIKPENTNIKTEQNESNPLPFPAPANTPEIKSTTETATNSIPKPADKQITAMKSNYNNN